MKAKKPNILFFLPDQYRYDWLGDNENLPLKTPNLDKIARKGIKFTNAFTPSPLCAPARACLASVRDYANCGTPHNQCDYPLEIPTYYQNLRDADYSVAGVGKFDLHKDTSDFSKLYWGLDGSHLLKEWGFTHGIDNEGKIDGVMSYIKNGVPRGPYLNFLQEEGLAELYVEEYKKYGNGIYTTELPEHAYCDNWIAENGLKIINEMPQEKPWHMVVNFAGPHNPMNVTKKMRERWRNIEFPSPYNYPEANFETEQKRRQNYAAMIENIDSLIGKYIAYLKNAGQWENTIIIFSSDHGEMLGDHSRQGKCLWHNQSSRIPLIISGPGIEKSKTTDALVSLQDIAATILDFANAKELPQMEARSLRNILVDSNTQKHREFIKSSLHNKNHNWDMIFDGSYKYVKNGNEEILHNLNEDPLELTNLAQKAKDKTSFFRALV
jgi:arylsulfatase A-like enzyme